MADLVEQVTGMLAVPIHSSRATVSVPAPLAAVRGDPHAIRQLMQNLISNAVKYTKEGVSPVVTITAQPVPREPGWIQFAVADQGIGIDARHREKIFTIFQRLHQRGEYPGTGIGLAICRRVVERHGGRIWVESQPGEGATFRFTLRESR